MFGVVFVQALRAPMRDPDWLRKALLGGLLVFVPTLALAVMVAAGAPALLIPALVIPALVPSFAAWGYVYRTFIDALNGVEPAGLPGWGAWKAYTMAGFWLFLIVLGYIFLAAVGMTALLSVLGLIPVGEDPDRLGALLMLMMAASLVLYGFFPIAFARFAADGRVWSAFDPGTIWKDMRRVVDGGYMQACFTFYGLLLFVNLVLGALPYAGLFLVSVALFYLMLVFARIFGAMIGVKGRQTPVSEEGN